MPAIKFDELPAEIKKDYKKEEIDKIKLIRAFRNPNNDTWIFWITFSHHAKRDIWDWIPNSPPDGTGQWMANLH